MYNKGDDFMEGRVRTEEEPIKYGERRDYSTIEK